MDNTNFFLKPFHQISNIVLEKQDLKEGFEEIIKILNEYFRKVKEHRTIEDVDIVLELIRKNSKLFQEMSSNERNMQEEVEDMREELKHFIEDNSEGIEDTFYNSEAGPFVLSWILTFDETTQILFNFMDAWKSKIRSRRRINNTTIKNNLLMLFKAVFLVLFRIIEQIYMIIGEEPYDLEKEKRYLIEDVVYLDNIQRSILYDVFR
ncbi:MAG: hypothetical protein ACTSUT_08065 [Promethearchaeota archaeon]